MANRFMTYNPAGTLDMADLGVKLYGIKEHSRLAERGHTLEEQRNKAYERSVGVQEQAAGRLDKESDRRFGPGGLEERQLSEQARLTKIKEDALALERSVTPIVQKPIPASGFAVMESTMKTIDKRFGTSLAKSAMPIFNKMRDWTENGYRRIDVYDGIKGQGNIYKPLIMDGLKKDLEKAVMSGDTQKQESIKQFMDSVDDWESFVDQVMPASAKYRELQMLKETKQTTPWKVTGYDKSGEPTLLSVPQGYTGNLPLGSFSKPTDELVEQQRKQNLSINKQKIRNSLAEAGDQDTAIGLVKTYNQQKGNEVAYWDVTKKNWWFDEEGVKYLTLSKEARDAGWTPEEIQRAADDLGVSPKDILKKLGLVK